MSRQFDPDNPSNPYAQNASNPYAATRHGSAEQSSGLFDDLLHHLRERELSLEDLLRVSLRLYRRYIVELGGAALVYGVVLGALNYLTFQQTIDWMVLQILQDPEEAPDAASLIEMVRPIAGKIAALSMATIIAQAAIALFTVIRTGERARKLDRATAAAESVGLLFQKLPLYLAVTFVAYMLIAVGALLCLVPGVYFAVHFALLAAMVGIGNEGFAAIKKSFAIVGPRFWKTAGALILCYVAVYLGPFVISSWYGGQILELITEQVAANPGLTREEAARAILQSPAYFLTTQLPGTIAGALFVSFTSVLTGLMYLNYTRTGSPADDSAPADHSARA